MLPWLKEILKDQYTEDIDKKISDQVGKEFVSRGDFNSLNETKKKLDEDIKTRDTQLEELKKVDAEGLKTKIEDLQKENKAAQEAHEAEMKQLKIDGAVEKALLGAKAKNIKAVKALLDLDKAELDGESVKGLEEQIKNLQKNEDSKFLFETTQTKKTQMKGFEPGEAGDGKSGLNKEQFQKLSYKERADLYNTDKATYDALIKE